MARAWLGIGANIGDPPAQLQAALDRLHSEQSIELIRSSSTLVNPAWGKTDQPHFHNLVAEVETDLTPDNLLAQCLAIEEALGRVRSEKWGPRTIDIDIVAYEQRVQQSATLTLPHPFAAERQFVMSPLREIAPKTAQWIDQQAGTRR